MRSQNAHSLNESKSTTNLKSVETSSDAVIETLKKSLADEYLLQLKTQNFHWNVEGPLFFSLHKLFEEQYGQLAEYVDRTAEVLRALKTKAPGSFKEFRELSSIQEASDKMSANQMIEMLSQDHTNLAIALKSRLETAEDAEETSAVTLYEDLIGFHEKAAWMIRSHKS
ncbi:DNA starvation/stationary phase protection protein [Bdellovibrio bacteriovorus]|uniref:Putative DNA protection during starvation or oxydative stress transcription regulator protein n=1 Tax=Bdellovibrio bacteriovorus (strain ATCC 15356 / DSM 50701 / NCIMB 9529 / HD100) TaxID=264462 RepID=Q6MJZ6_BDEBA|nr:DNA starvation/stationary phase protection protein [Bdellovibrio bacteriovorus]CAE80413.1 putative DNA protection during starvation or oxydative stress transcription regulator protein [Bdellovibrio bacteriovorus HD100]